MRGEKQLERKQELWIKSKILDQDKDNFVRKIRIFIINLDNWKGG